MKKNVLERKIGQAPAHKDIGVSVKVEPLGLHLDGARLNCETTNHTHETTRNVVPRTFKPLRSPSKVVTCKNTAANFCSFTLVSFAERPTLRRPPRLPRRSPYGGHDELLVEHTIAHSHKPK